MNTHDLKCGGRVRMTAQCRMHDYQPGDKDLVLREMAAGAEGTRYYQVVMDKDQPTYSPPILTEDEIEPVV
jgi:hypothetical protein